MTRYATREAELLDYLNDVRRNVTNAWSNDGDRADLLLEALTFLQMAEDVLREHPDAKDRARDAEVTS